MSPVAVPGAAPGVQRQHRLAVSEGADDHLGEHGRIPQPQVEPLPGDRMQCLRGIADQHSAGGDGGGGARQLQRIGRADARAHEPPGAPPEPLLQLPQVSVVIKRQNLRGPGRRAGPDDSITPIVQRQHRQRA